MGPSADEILIQQVWGNVKGVVSEQLCTGQFTTNAHNLILVGGTGTGKTHIAIALGAALISQGKKARFHNAVDLINALIKEQAEGNAGKISRYPPKWVNFACLFTLWEEGNVYEQNSTRDSAQALDTSICR